MIGYLVKQNIDKQGKEESKEMIKIKIEINGLTMKELNGNEKFYNLEYSLPVTSQSVNQINKGDLMLFHDNCLVLFYQDFLSKYQYTRIGQIDDAGNINQIVGAGDLVVSFMKYRNGEENGNN